MTTIPHTVDTLKAQARALRQALSKAGSDVTHSQSLELLARQHRLKDWNTLHAKASKTEAPRFQMGQRVAGRYLGKRFDGEIIAVSGFSGREQVRLTIRFDQPIDVVAFEGLSSLRSRVNAVVGRDGRTLEKTSDGRPHLELDL